MNEETLLETSEIISDEEINAEQTFTQIDYTDYFNRIIENQNKIIEKQEKALEEFQKVIENYDEDISFISENFERLQEQNETLIQQQTLIYECVGNMFGLAVAFCVGIVLHKVLSVINGA